MTSVAVVGAGIVGLSTAWFLQEHGFDVTVVERSHVAAGASWGNAGWLMPGDATPLASPATLRMGLQGLTRRGSALAVPMLTGPDLYRFLLRFARNCTSAQWERSLHALVPLSNAALDAYDDLAAGGVSVAPTRSQHHLACFTSVAARDDFAGHLKHLRAQGVQVEFDVMDGNAARSASSVVSGSVKGAVGLLGQRFLDPTLFVPALAESFVERGGTIRVDTEARSLRDIGHAAEVLLMRDGRPSVLRFDTVVLCTGAWLSTLAKRFGVSVPVRAGRGYSFNIRTDVRVDDPIYLPDQHLACTPMRGRLRIAGAMEFRAPNAPVDPRRIHAMVEAARPMLDNVDLDDRTEEWVGPRPVSADGTPLVGPTASPRVWCVGGHAMEGMVLGPITARLAAQGIAERTIPSALSAFSPLR